MPAGDHATSSGNQIGPQLGGFKTLAGVDEMRERWQVGARDAINVMSQGPHRAHERPAQATSMRSARRSKNGRTCVSLATRVRRPTLPFTNQAETAALPRPHKYQLFMALDRIKLLLKERLQ